MENIEEKIYSGLLGKAIGVRLGAPIEPYQWDDEKIRESYGDIRGYVKDSWRFAADDDTNGPLFFIRSLMDEKTFDMTPEAIGRAWLNYTRDGQGMFWWGGEGVSTEHTAYSNLKKGMGASLSGKAETNTPSLSEQVGGQIFIDSWGLISPGEIEKAMDAAEIAASVSHDGEALIGARFIAGLISGAFIHENIHELVEDVLLRLPKESLYRAAMTDIQSFHHEHPEDFREAYAYAQEKYSYSHYEGLCPVIPNACIVLLGLLYSNNDFARSIEITCMCAWDTDSNAGVVGTIMGVLKGLRGIPDHYREPINDLIICSSMSPTLNVTNIPAFAKLLAGMVHKEIHETKHLSLDFTHPGSTCGLRIRNDFRLVRDRQSKLSSDGYDVLMDNLVKGDTAAIYYQTFYQKDDFGDNRYDPVFAPLVYPGQVLQVQLESKIDFIDDLWAAPYVKYAKGYEYTHEFISLEEGIRKNLTFQLPEYGGHLIKEVGIKVKTRSEAIDGNGLLGRLKILKFEVSGGSSFILSEDSFEPGFIGNVAPFSNHRIETDLSHGTVRFTAHEEQGVSLTGNYFTKDVEFRSSLRNIVGEDILIPFRAKGLENYYYVRVRKNTISIMRRLNFENILLNEIQIENGLASEFAFTLIVRGANLIFITHDNTSVISYSGIENEYGHFGFGGVDTTFEIIDAQIKTGN